MPTESAKARRSGTNDHAGLRHTKTVITIAHAASTTRAAPRAAGNVAGRVSPSRAAMPRRPSAR